MMHRNVFLTLMLVALVLASALVWAAPGEGDPAPDFNYEDLDGNTLSFSEVYADRVVVLELFSLG